MAVGDGLWPVVLRVFFFVITAPPAMFTSTRHAAGGSSSSPDPACGSHVLVLFTEISSTAAPAPSAGCSLGPGHCSQQDRVEQ